MRSSHGRRRHSRLLVRAIGGWVALIAAIVAIDALARFAVPEFSPPGNHRRSRPAPYLRQHLGEERFDSVGPLAPDYRSYFGVHNFSPKLDSHYVHTRDNPRVASARFQPNTRTYQLDGSARPYFGAAGCQVTSGDRDSAWIVCPRRITLVRRETWFPGWSAEIDGRPTGIQSADGPFQAVTVPAASHHIMFSFVPPGMDGAPLGWLAGVAVMLVPAARSASSFRIRG